MHSHAQKRDGRHRARLVHGRGRERHRGFWFVVEKVFSLPSKSNFPLSLCHFFFFLRLRLIAIELAASECAPGLFLSLFLFLLCTKHHERFVSGAPRHRRDRVVGCLLGDEEVRRPRGASDADGRRCRCRRRRQQQADLAPRSGKKRKIQHLILPLAGAYERI